MPRAEKNSDRVTEKKVGLVLMTGSAFLFRLCSVFFFVFPAAFHRDVCATLILLLNSITFN